MEPVKMKAPIPQLDTPSSRHEDAEESDATEHEYHESLNSSDENLSSDTGDESESSQSSGSQDKDLEKIAASDAAPKGRKRRRASSSGIITA
jgi:ribonuclease E